jgi:hypothetical protein
MLRPLRIDELSFPICRERPPRDRGFGLGRRSAVLCGCSWNRWSQLHQDGAEEQPSGQLHPVVIGEAISAIDPLFE